MTLPKTTTPTSNLNSKLEKIGLRAVAQNLDDFIARATTGRWSPHMMLEQLSEIGSGRSFAPKPGTSPEPVRNQEVQTHGRLRLELA